MRFSEVSSSSQKDLFSTEIPSLEQDSEVISEQVLEQILQDLEERLNPIKEQIKELSKSLEELKPIEHQINKLSQSLKKLKPIEAKPKQPSESLNNNTKLFSDTKLIPDMAEGQGAGGKGDKVPPLNATWSNKEKNNYTQDDSGSSSELSYFAQSVLEDFNKKEVNFTKIYPTRLNLSITEESFGYNYKGTLAPEEETTKWSKNLYLEKDSQGIFSAIKDQDSDNYLLVLNQKRLTPKQLKNTFEFSLKHIDQIFDGGKKFDKNKHTGVKIVSPAIAVKDSEILELKHKGKLEFF